MLIDQAFLNELEDIEMIFKPLNKAQNQSESDDTNIRYIISRWIKIKDELEQLYDKGKFSQLDSVLGSEGE